MVYDRSDRRDPQLSKRRAFPSRYRPFEITGFCGVALAAIRELDLDPAKVNVRGGAVALGHPIGASGARILTTLVHALRHAGKRRGVAAICIGGGEATAMLVETA